MRSWWRIRAGSCIPYRWVFSTAVVVLAVTAAQLTQTGLLRLLDADGPAEVALAMVAAAAAYLVVDALLCGLAISQIVPGSTRRETLGGRDEFGVDATAATLGCLIAAAVITTPWAAPFAIPIVLTAQRALLLDQIESEAQTDAKTSLARVDWWRKRTEQMLRQARTQRDPLAVLLIDIDHFKQINDLHGHLVGDEALRAIATILRGTIRSKDVIGRFGGEEFVVALPDVGVADAAVTADRLRPRSRPARWPRCAPVCSTSPTSTRRRSSSRCRSGSRCIPRTADPGRPAGRGRPGDVRRQGRRPGPGPPGRRPRGDQRTRSPGRHWRRSLHRPLRTAPSPAAALPPGDSPRVRNWMVG